MIRARHGLITQTLAAFICVTLGVTLLIPKTYTASSDLFLDYKQTDPIRGRLFSSSHDESYQQTQIDMIRGQSVADKVIELLELRHSSDYLESTAKSGEARTYANLVKTINEQTTVSTKNASRILEVGYSADTPETARDFANAIVNAYMAVNQEILTSAARSRREQYNAQLEHLRKEIDALQDNLTKYQQDNNILTSGDHNDLKARELNDLITALSLLKTKHVEVKARTNAIDQLIRNGIPPDELPEIAMLPNINDLKSKLSDVNKRLSDAQSVLGEQHPKIIGLMDERKQLLARINQEAVSALQTLRIDVSKLALQEASLQSIVTEQTAVMLVEKKHRDVISSYMRQLESVERVYNAALQKYDELLMASQIDTPDFAVLRPATAPTKHAKPNLLKNLIASLFVGLLVGVCLALLAELRQRRIRTVEDLIYEINLPVLGQIGTAKGLPA